MEKIKPVQDTVKQFATTDSISNIEILERLGAGNFGEVWKGRWQGTTFVALKKLKDSAQAKEFESEANVLK
jgi:predicted Ser/Thr protein kinase